MKTWFTTAQRDYDYPRTKHVREIGRDTTGRVWRQVELPEDYRGEAQQERYASGLHAVWSVLEYDSMHKQLGLIPWHQSGCYSEVLRLDHDIECPNPAAEPTPYDPVQVEVGWASKPVIRAGLYQVVWHHILGPTMAATWISPCDERGRVNGPNIVLGGCDLVFEPLRDALCGDPAWRYVK